ncbi:hypothetical protein BJX99DRAFT_56453 [Aspergillus californicus]
MGFPFLSRRPSSSPFSFLTLLSLLSLSTAQTVDLTVLPSNNSADLSDGVRFYLEGSQVDLPRNFTLAPLTRSLQVSFTSRQLADLNRTGSLVQAANLLSLQSTDIAFVSCDPDAYPGNLDASATVNGILNSQQRPAAVLLYSTIAQHCNYTNDRDDYAYIFTSLSPYIAETVEAQLRSGSQTGSSSILPVMTSFGINPTMPDGDGSTDSPNTAMIILYSITGIITALFLSIIITGAVRAHRHPERYGPRQRPGRPRQSRARGMARAMLETIPIVKFGDNNDGKLDADKGDVEMSVEAQTTLREDETENRQPPMATGGTTSPVPEETPQDPATSTETKERSVETAETETSADHPNFSCPICTDDFVKGQDLRVLPCNHQFHPDCIDPWLVNVSGTCPLCRIDLNPPKTEGEEETQEGENRPEEQDITAAQQPGEETPTHRHRRLSNLIHGPLNARRMRDASVEERLAALRSVREEANREAEAESGSDEQQNRRHRLTARFRDRFRIRTRAHGDDSNNNASSST